jgi:hypothetical protein
MNVGNIRKVIEAIKAAPWMEAGPTRYIPNGKMPDGFNMSTFLSSTICGTVGCIGGFAACLASKEAGEAAETHGYNRLRADQYLGVDSDTLALLYLPVDANDITPDQAVAVLEHLIETGQVDWARFTNQTILR